MRQRLQVTVALLVVICMSKTWAQSVDSHLDRITVYVDTYDQGLFRLQLPGGVMEPLFTEEDLPTISTDDQQLAYWSEGQLWITALADWSPHPTSIAFEGIATAIDWLPNDTRVLITYDARENGLPRTVAFNTLTSEIEPWGYAGPCAHVAQEISSGEFVFVCLDSFDFEPLATMSWDGELQQYNSEDLQTFSAMLSPGTSRRFDFSEDGSIVAFVEEDGGGIDDYLRLSTSMDYLLKVNLGFIGYVRFSPDTSLIASVNFAGMQTDRQSLYVWESLLGINLSSMWLGWGVIDLTWYPDGRKLVALTYKYPRTYLQIVNLADESIMEYDISEPSAWQIAVVQNS